jgi:uncharacterized LabA/DUF88 family protein
MKNNTRVYIDGANLHKGILSASWVLDYRRFYIWLQDRFKICEIYLFIGFLKEKKEVYMALAQMGYILVYKEVSRDREGNVKGNCDSHLIVHAMRDVCSGGLDHAVLVSSDGDFVPLVQHWKEKNIQATILSPYERVSLLLLRENVETVLLPRLKNKLQARNEKSLDGDKTP